MPSKPVEVDRVAREVEPEDLLAARVLLLQRDVVVVGEAVEADDLVALGAQGLGEMRADEAGGAGDEIPHRSALQRPQPAAVLDEADLGVEAGHRDAGAILAERRLGPLAVRERERELRVAAAGGERQREGAAEARVDVGHGERAVGLAEALDARRPDDPDRLGDGRACSIRSGSRIDIPLIDSPPLDWIIVRAIALRQRPSRSQKTSIENSSPTHSSCTIDSTGVWRRKNSSSVGIGRPVDVPRAEAFADLDEQRIAGVVRHLAREPRARALDAVLLEEHMRDVLVGHRRAHLVRRREQEGRLELRRGRARRCSGRCP